MLLAAELTVTKTLPSGGKDAGITKRKGEIYFEFHTKTVIVADYFDFIERLFCGGGDCGGFPEHNEAAQAGGGRG